MAISIEEQLRSGSSLANQFLLEHFPAIGDRDNAILRRHHASLPDGLLRADADVTPYYPYTNRSLCLRLGWAFSDAPSEALASQPGEPTTALVESRGLEPVHAALDALQHKPFMLDESNASALIRVAQTKSAFLRLLHRGLDGARLGDRNKEMLLPMGPETILSRFTILASWFGSLLRGKGAPKGHPLEYAGSRTGVELKDLMSLVPDDLIAYEHHQLLYAARQQSLSADGTGLAELRSATTAEECFTWPRVTRASYMPNARADIIAGDTMFNIERGSYSAKDTLQPIAVKRLAALALLQMGEMGSPQQINHLGFYRPRSGKLFTMEKLEFFASLGVDSEQQLTLISNAYHAQLAAAAQAEQDV